MLTQIADLEISNASLLVVNQGLERLTREQSLEIRQLRKQLRQSLRVSHAFPLPPPSEDEDSSEEEASDDDDDEVDIRVSLEKSIFLTEQMVKEGRRGLEYRVRTSELPSGGRVLSREWREIGE
jgi:hypothetical protein